MKKHCRCKRVDIKSHEACWMLYVRTLQSLAIMLKNIHIYYASSKTRILRLTTDTSKAVHAILNGIMKLITFLLTKVKHVLIMEFQSDKIGGVFGIYRQLSVRNYHISVQHVLNNLTFLRLRLFNMLNLEQSSAHHTDCCEVNLEEHEIVALNTCVEESLWLDETEHSSLH